MNTKTTYHKLSELENIIENGELDEINTCKEWGGAYVIITTQAPDKMTGRMENDTFVITKHAEILSKLFCYVKDNFMKTADNYLYGFMALLANDFIAQNSDENPQEMLKYIFKGISIYLIYYDFENSMGDSAKAFNLMKLLLSENTSDEDIKKIL